MGIDEGGLNAELGNGVLQEIEGAAVDGLLRHDVVAGLGKCLNGKGDCRSAGCYRQASNAAFKSSDAIFEDALGGIGKATVDVACVRQAEAVGGMLGVAENIAGGLVDRHGAGIGGGVCFFLAYMESQGVELEFMIGVVYELAHCEFLSVWGSVFRLRVC